METAQNGATPVEQGAQTPAQATTTSGSVGTTGAGTVTPASPKAAKVTAKATLVVEYTCDVDEAKGHAKSIVDALRGQGLTVKGEIKETVPSTRAL